MEKSRIYIGGNIYGAGNIGDDAVLQGILRILQFVAPQAVITVGTYRGQRLEYLPSSLQYVDSSDIRQITAAIRQSDCFISGGGTMIGDELGLSFPLEYNAKLISMAKLCGKRVSMLGIGANQLRKNEGMSIAKTIVGLCDLITVRDEESLHVCLELGAETGSTATTADPAFLLSAKRTTRTKDLKERLRARGPIFGINVVNEAWTDLSTYKKGIAVACEYFFSKHGYLPVFFCNEVRPGNFFDFDANSQTAALLRCDHELLEPIYYSPEEMIDILSNFEFVIGMRMHSLIFSAITGTPFIAISRVDKVDNFMKLLGLRNSGSVDVCEGRQIIFDIERLLEGREAFQNQMAERITLLRQDALKNIDMLLNLMNEHRVLWHKANASSLRFAMSGNKFHDQIQRVLHGEITFAQIVRKLRKAFGQKGRM